MFAFKEVVDMAGIHFMGKARSRSCIIQKIFFRTNILAKKPEAFDDSFQTTTYVWKMTVLKWLQWFLFSGNKQNEGDTNEVILMALLQP